MLRVGLTGGLATGKTFVGRALAGLGCDVIDADQLGHEVLAPGGEAFDPVLDEFGPAILDPAGAIDRRRLAAAVFDNPGRLAALNRLVHPHVIRREEALLRDIASRDPRAIAVLEAAILIETGSYRRFQKIILTVCGRDQQLQRAVERDALTLSEAEARLARQMPLDEKRRFADYIIDTSGSKDDTLAQVRATYNLLRSLPQ
jgi:dephospho-CoA kinase